MADDRPEPTPEHEADLAALADGRLDPARRSDLLARAESDPELAAAIARQRSAVAMIAAASEEVSAPLALRAGIERMRSQPRRRTLGDRLMGGRAWLAPLGFAAMAALALVVLRPAGGPGFGEVVAAAARPPLAAVAPLGSGPLLREHVESVRFPNFEGKFGWRATGVRSDRIGGRATGTVFYDRGGTRLAYTIVGGDALGDPPGTATDRGGVRLRSFTRAGRTVVTWRRQGHTCVLSATGVSRATLLELAAWKGKGAVAF